MGTPSPMISTGAVAAEPASTPPTAAQPAPHAEPAPSTASVPAADLPPRPAPTQVVLGEARAANVPVTAVSSSGAGWTLVGAAQ